jgi:DNA-binding SARP family transcriptional activator
MIRLRTLGSLELVGDDGHPLRSILAQPKRLALLVHLAAAPHGFHRRDRLVGIFWPELDQEHARAALRKAIHFLRRSLGEGVLVGRGDEELGLDPDRIWCDAAAFDVALAAGQTEEALTLYGGELAPGLFVADAPEFEGWLAAERARLAGAAAEAAWSLAEREEGAGNALASARAAARAAALQPYDEAAHRRRIALLHRLGDRGGALQAHDAFVARLGAELEVEPSEETAALAAWIRSAAEPRPAVPAPVAAEVAAAEAAEAPPEPARPARPAPRRRTLAALAGLGLTALLAMAVVAGERGGTGGDGGAAATPDAGLVAIVPFRVGGAEPGLGYLREGMIDLLSTLLTGEGGPRAADPRQVLNSWRAAGGGADDLSRDDALRVALRIGAGGVLAGEVVGTPDRLVLSATILSVADGNVQARASVEGPADSLTVLIDQLVASLLSRGAGEGEHRLAGLTSTSLPALRAYLEGQAAHRRGRYVDAIRHFERAVGLDSAFALAGLGMFRAAGWVGGTDVARARGPAVAWAARERLSARDRVLFAALFGPRYPGVSSGGERLEAIDEALRAAPDEPDLWYELGDQLFHYGELRGRPGTLEQAERAFRRALELDPDNASTLQHLVQLTARVGDARGARAFGARYLALDSAGPTADFLRWRVAVAEGDEAALAHIRARLDELGPAALRWVAVTSQDEGVAARDARRAVSIRLRLPGTRDERLERLRGLHALELNQGRPGGALEATRRLAEVERLPGDHLRQPVLDALYSDGDRAAAAEAAARLEARAAGLPADTPDGRRPQYEDLCVAAQWRLAGGDASTAAAAINRLRNSSPAWDGEPTVERNRVCASILEAQLAALQRRPEAATLLERLDSLMRTSPPTGPTDHGSLDYGNLAAARLWAAAGEPRRALAAVRRRIHFLGWHPFVSTYLREEARLAAAAGDAAAARRAYERYLELRHDPGPALLPEVERVRAELARLQGR